MEGKTKEFFALSEQTDTRRMPLFPSTNLSYDLVKASNSAVWPPALHMLCADQAPEEAQVHLIRSMITNGFDVRQSLACNLPSDKQHKVLFEQISNADELTSQSIWTGIALILAIKNKSFEVLKLLWSDLLSELWTREHLKMVLDLCF